MGLGHRALLATAVLMTAAIALPPLAAAQAPPGAQDATEFVVIEVLSNRADLISDGNALVEVRFPDGSDPASAVVDVDGSDVTDAFAVRDDGRYLGRVEGLDLGPNVLSATLPDGRGARITITNHPRGGPVIAGPQILPWGCVERSEDDQCNRETTYEFRYKSTRRSGFQPYDPESPPSDVAETTTDEGVTVPFIIRIETGVIDRDEYRIAVLYDPEQPWEPWAPQEAFNQKLVITHGASCDTQYRMASAPDVLKEDALSRGFALMSHALNNSGHNCNIATEAEAMIMTKEHLVERYGELRYTIGSGCSGGSLVQQQVANAYPGFYQGITPACSFTDAWSSGMQYADYQILRPYFENPSRWQPGVAWEASSIEQVYGHPNPANPVTFTEVIPSKEADRPCPGVPPEDVYDAETNPGGVRCTLQDYMVNVFGRFPDTGYARKPTGNVGIQYGLEGLLAGNVSPAQFTDLNAKVGGQNLDGVPQPQRAAPDPLAAQRAYRSGANDTASNLDEVAIIDLRGPDPGAFHDVYRTYVMRDRLLREHGTAANQVLWRGSVPLFGDTGYVDQSIVAMDSWLAVIEADDRDVPLAQKIIEDRPDAVTDRCTDGNGNDVTEEYCDGIVEAYSSPRIFAGMPSTDDVMDCQLKPLDRNDYGEVEFTDDQWTRLQETYPTGVCNWELPSQGDGDTVPWLDYSDVAGGEPLGQAPVSVPFGPGADGPTGVLRFGGVDRVATAVAVSRAEYEAADVVVLARSDAFADALAGAPLTVALGAPLLLTTPDALPAATAAEIGRLGAATAVVLGGETAIRGSQVDALQAELGLQVERLAGVDRYATSAAIAQRLGGAAEAFVASGNTFPDALSASALAAAQRRPVLLVPGDEVPESVAAVLTPNTAVTVVGGVGAVSTAVEDALDQQAGTLRRLAGDNRFATSRAVADEALARGLTPEVTWIATGSDFPDGLVAGAAAGADGGVLLLVDGRDPAGSSEALGFLGANRDAVREVRIAGGLKAVSPEMEAALRDAVADQ